MWPRLVYKRIFAVLLLSICSLPLLILLTPNLSLYDVESNIRYYLFPSNSIKCFRFNPVHVPSLPDISTYKIRKGQSIFFHETSCKHHSHGHIYLEARQACAVESAARSNPKYDVFLTFSAPGIITSTNSQSDRILGALRSYDNINLVHLNFENYTKGTLLEEIYESGKLEASSFAISHASDILRYLTLYKFGGIYLDLDVVVVKSLADLYQNFAGAETQWNVAAGVMAMEPKGAGHQYAEACITDLKEHFSAHEWGNNGPMIVTRLLRKLCNVQLSKDMVNRTCDHFHVYPPYMFYPVPWENWRLYFDSESVPKVFHMIKDAHVLHVWNRHSAEHKLPVDSHTAYTLFAKKFCPRVFAECDQYF